MSRQKTKNELMDLISGTKENKKLIDICFDDEISERKPGDPPIIRFVDFRKKNEEAIQNGEAKSGS